MQAVAKQPGSDLSGQRNSLSLREMPAPSRLEGRAVAPAPPESSSLSVICYYCAQVFRCKNVLNLTAVTVITASTSLLIIATPYLFANTVQDGVTNFIGIKLTRFEVIACFTSAVFLSKILPIVRRMVVHPVVSRVAIDALYSYDAQDLKQSHSYQLVTSVGDKSAAIHTALMSSAELTSQALNNIFPSICEMGAVIGILSANYGWVTGIWVGGVTAASLAVNFLSTGFVRRAFAEYKNNRMGHYRQMTSLWTNFESLYYFNAFSYELKKIREAMDRAQISETNNLQVPERINLINNIITQASLLGLVLYSGQKMVDGTYSQLDLSIIIYFVLQIGLPLNTLGESFNKFRANCLDLIPVVNFLRNQPATSLKPALDIPPDNAEVVFDSVGFSYKDDKGAETTLKNVSFRAKAGETIALVGMTAAGKSTIAKLLFRLYDPQVGNISINGQDINDVDVESLRNQLSIVPQNPVLFNDTIRYNIAYGAFSNFGDSVPENMIWDALEQAGLPDEVRRLPEGLDTMVGQAGLRLSGGQLLRVAIARAIIRNAPIVILDEYTSALDSQTEALIQKSLKHSLEKKLKIVIAHRLSTIKDADRILVLDNGVVKEEGNFDELMEKNGLFKHFWEEQQKLPVEEVQPDAALSVQKEKAEQDSSSDDDEQKPLLN